jgi:glucose-6-phosphate isomerase
MQLPDEAIAYNYQNAFAAAVEEWSAAGELRARHMLHHSQLREMTERLMKARGQIVADRELRNPSPEQTPLEAGFIDLPQQTLDGFRRHGEASLLGKVLAKSRFLRESVDRVVLLGIGGSYLGARALFEALRSSYHNELLPRDRPNMPRIYFEGNNVDNDALQELFDLLQLTCVDPDIREERWGVVIISKSGGTLETAAVYRAIRREMVEYYGHHSPMLASLLLPITGESGKLRDLMRAEGLGDDDMLTIPANVGGRYSVFSPAGLLPAAVMGLDVRALLLGAATMTKRFMEEPFERNPVLQFAAVNFLMAQTKPMRVLSIWSKKLEALGLWYDQLVAESLGKQGVGPTPITSVQTRDLHSRGQQHQEGGRDKFINNLTIKNAGHPPIMIGMMDHNQDDLNQFNRKSLLDVQKAALCGVNQAYHDVARPTADLCVPILSEHTMGQLMQMLMLATVVEGRLMGVNPYGQPGVEAYKSNMKTLLKR